MRRRHSYSSSSGGGSYGNLPRNTSLTTLDVLGSIGQAISDVFFEVIITYIIINDILIFFLYIPVNRL